MTALWPLKEALFTAYDRALRQRNRLLKEWEGPGTPQGMDAWDEALVTAGAALVRARTEAVSHVAPFAAEEFKALAGYDLIAAYAPNVTSADPGAATEGVEDAFRARISERRHDELARRTSI